MFKLIVRAHLSLYTVTQINIDVFNFSNGITRKLSIERAEFFVESLKRRLFDDSLN